MAEPVIDILMYHQIAAGDHPTKIAPAVFAEQMDAIAETKIPVITLDRFLDVQDHKQALKPRSVIITFDDAFTDFSDVAWPILQSHGFPATVYVPTGHVGGTADWAGAAERAPIMGWDRIRELSDEGVTFGSHSVSHPALDALSATAASEELRASRATLEDKLGKPVRHFAPPYGRGSPETSRLIADHYATSVSTRLDSASISTTRLDLPRLEMYYFRSGVRWRRHLEGRGNTYLTLRKLARRARTLF